MKRRLFCFAIAIIVCGISFAQSDNNEDKQPSTSTEYEDKQPPTLKITEHRCDWCGTTRCSKFIAESEEARRRIEYRFHAPPPGVRLNDGRTWEEFVNSGDPAPIHK